jgi:predicted GIY-YIG superfamily endonuclease
VFQAQVGDKSAALKREYALKQLSKQAKEQLVAAGLAH